MKTFYFIGGPIQGKADEFFSRLAQIGGPPPSWTIYPHAAKDGKALHLVQAASQQEILDHLKQFVDIYERTEIVEVVQRP
ncbi:MAG TPA: hypothetical protein VGK74_14425 [Symbiobacteriaceae bacterium]